VHQTPTTKAQRLENCKMVVDTVRGLKLKTDVRPRSIENGDHGSILALLGILIKFQHLSVVSTLLRTNKYIREEQILNWANDQVTKLGQQPIQDFYDETLIDSHFFSYLLHIYSTNGVLT